MKKILFVMKGSISSTNEEEGIDLNNLRRLDDGSVVFSVAPMRTGDYEYLGIEMANIANDIGAEWDDIIVGNIQNEEAEKVLSSFEGLPVTNEHVFIGANNSDQVAGTVLSQGTLDDEGFVQSKLVINDKSLLAEIESGKKVEVSIGFYADIPEVNSKSDQEGEPDFYISNIQLNHLAVVERGRAGRKAKLSNSEPLMVNGFNKYFSENEEIAMKLKKLKINNVEHELSEDAVSAIEAERQEHKTEISNAQAELKKVQSDNVGLEGQVAQLEKQIENADSVEETAAKMVVEHDATVKMLKDLDSHVEITFGDYDKTEIVRAALENASGKDLKDKSFDQLLDFYNGFSCKEVVKSNKGALEGAHSKPITLRSDSVGNGGDEVMQKVRNSMKRKQNKEESNNA